MAKAQENSDQSNSQNNTNELKEKLQQKQNDPNQAMIEELQRKLEEQSNNVALLQQQLEQKQNSEEQKAQEAERSRLEEEADLKRTLGMVESDKIEQLTNKELVDIMADAVEKSVDARAAQFSSVMDNKIKQLNEQLSTTQKAIMSVATAMDVREIRSQHNDFDDYQKEAATIMQEKPGLSVEDAYLLAKARKAGNSPPANNTARERPDSTISRSANDRLDEVTERRRRQKKESAREQTQSRNGIVNFRDIIQRGVDNVIAQREYGE